MTAANGKSVKKLCRLVQTAAALTLAVCLSTVSVFAEEQQSVNTASITVVLEDTDSGIVVSGEDVYLYKVAGFTDYKTHEYLLESDFESALPQLDLSSPEKTCSAENTQTLVKYVTDNRIQPDEHSVSDAKGTAEFGKVDNGIYLITFGENDAFSVSEFIVEAPMHGEDGYVFDIKASPKISIEPTDSTPDSSTPDPSSSSVSDSSSSNPDSSSGGGDIPQTGQPNLPIPILLIGGTTLVVFGIADGRMSRGRDDEE